MRRFTQIAANVEPAPIATFAELWVIATKPGSARVAPACAFHVPAVSVVPLFVTCVIRADAASANVPAPASIVPVLLSRPIGSDVVPVPEDLRMVP